VRCGRDRDRPAQARGVSKSNAQRDKSRAAIVPARPSPNGTFGSARTAGNAPKIAGSLCGWVRHGHGVRGPMATTIPTSKAIEKLAVAATDGRRGPLVQKGKCGSGAGGVTETTSPPPPRPPCNDAMDPRAVPCRNFSRTALGTAD
jgi:hypothetical protein